MLLVDSTQAKGIESVGSKVRNLLLLSSAFPVPPIVGLAQTTPGDTQLPAMLDHFLNEQEPGTLFAVRSSASVEDTSIASFAGMFETVLGVKRKDIPLAISTVLNSIRGERIADYAESRAVDPKEILLSVGIQRMVAADVSGVAFSRSPTESRLCLIEAIFGLGELLVQGHVNPEQWLIERTALAVSSMRRSVQRDRLVLSPDGGTERTELPSTDRRAPKLDEEEALKIAGLALGAEKTIAPEGADIEWAIERGELWLLQARPITA